MKGFSQCCTPSLYAMAFEIAEKNEIRLHLLETAHMEPHSLFRNHGHSSCRIHVLRRFLTLEVTLVWKLKFILFPPNIWKCC